mmetsp:Transcript_25647/g.40204  ORF Transcript_25647/g.40204 Transcript_25647/m.40204 type:complete len:409 (+) Transcript_25647:298-1524(+)
MLLETEVSRGRFSSQQALVAEKANLDAQLDQNNKDCLESLQQVKLFDSRCRRTAYRIQQRCRQFEEINGCEEDLLLTPSAGRGGLWDWSSRRDSGDAEEFPASQAGASFASSHLSPESTGHVAASRSSSIPEKFKVHAIGENILKGTGSNRIEGNMTALGELRMRLGLIEEDKQCWRTSPNVEYAATDASIVLLCKSDDKKAELVQDRVSVQAKKRYLLRVQGIKSECGDAVVGITIRSTAVGDVLAQEHQRFWGGASGWDDPEPLTSALEQYSGNPADVDQLQVLFEAPENEVSVSVQLLNPEEGQQVHFQSVQLLEIWSADICHPRQECQMMWLEESMEDSERDKRLSERKIRESLRRRTKLEEIKAQLARKRITLGVEEAGRSLGAETSEYDPTPPRSPREDFYV